MYQKTKKTEKLKKVERKLKEIENASAKLRVLKHVNTLSFIEFFKSRSFPKISWLGIFITNACWCFLKQDGAARLRDG